MAEAGRVVTGVQLGQAGHLVEGEFQRGRLGAAAQREDPPGHLGVPGVVARALQGLAGEQQGVQRRGDVVRGEQGRGREQVVEAVAGAARADLHLAGQPPGPGLRARDVGHLAQQRPGLVRPAGHPGLPGGRDQGVRGHVRRGGQPGRVAQRRGRVRRRGRAGGGQQLPGERVVASRRGGGAVQQRAWTAGVGQPRVDRASLVRGSVVVHHPPQDGRDELHLVVVHPDQPGVLGEAQLAVRVLRIGRGDQQCRADGPGQRGEGGPQPAAQGARGRQGHRRRRLAADLLRRERRGQVGQRGLVPAGQFEQRAGQVRRQRRRHRFLH
ncbi:hypothetical protein [Nucisporomicrobium flavum]|uniref:hypothetical protein n=1 Tax=Nucisporomicrobium flavum TaxID=2785915 RepID=UPI0018F3FAA7|nr:hypothetical protein [Nucisporomicrobium flavum]